MALTAKKVYAILKRQISDMEAKLNSPVRYRGTVATADLLPLNPDIGDMYNIESKSVYGEAGMNVAWNGVVWDTMGAPIDMSLYLTKEEAETVIQRLVTEYFEKNPVKPGATTEQAQQIEQNKTDIASLKTETGSLKEDISTKITKFYASSQGETHLADSDNGKIQDMMVYGKSEQKQYSGKNLINGVHLSFLGNAIIFDIDKVIVNGTLSEELGASFSRIQLKAGTYTLSSSFNCISKIGINPNFGILNVGNKFKTFTISEDMEINLVVIVPSGSHNSIDYIMLNEGSDALPWEPYTGGQPSPSPDYPQEIKSVVNPTVKAYGENFYSGSDLIRLTRAYTTDFMPVILHNGKICISFDAFSDTSDGKYHINVTYFDANKEQIGGNGAANEIRNNISRVKIEFDGRNVGNDKVLDLKNVLYIKITFGIYNNTATKITYKNIMISATDFNFKPYKPVQTVTLPYALNAIPANSGGNVTIDGQQYIADYVDVERGKLIRMVDYSKLDNTQSIVNKTEWLLAESQEIDLTTEEITAFKALTTYYPTTNISVNSEQLDGYTAFNYPISMANGWNYVKKQLNDNRDYIYDMDTRTQDIDTQAAEAYVNSEYAVALTELEV